MADNVLARQDGDWIVISTLPDVCKTPMGSSSPPVPYPVVSNLGPSLNNSPNVRANGNPVVRFDSSYTPTTMGDQAGVGTGVQSGTVGGQCWPKEKSGTVFVNGKPVIRHDDQFWMNGSYSPTAAKARRWKARKATIANGREKAASMPPGPERDKVEAAADRFERNNSGVEYAKLSSDVYHPGADASETMGWTNISNDAAALDKYGLKPADLTIPHTNFRVQVYEPDPDVFGADMKPGIAFKGTDLGSASDLANDAQQATGSVSQYYERAVKIGKDLARKGADVVIAGHSLGGGTGSTASMASGLPAYTYNAAGSSPATVAKYGATPIASDIQAYRVQDEVLTSTQENALVKGLIPAAMGTPRVLPGTGDKVSRHFMSSVLDGIEKQKRQDEATLTRAIANG
jgi:hypothetical protein